MDENEVELIQRRLTDEVRETVRGQLFRTCSIVGVAVLAVIGYANWNIFDEMNDEIRGRADAAVREAVDEVRTKIEDLKEDVSEQYGAIEVERQRANFVRDQVTITPLPADAGRFLSRMQFEILRYDIVGHVAGRGREVLTGP